jgi:hypothetical protein
MIDSLGPHVADTGAEASDGKNQNVAHSLVLNLVGEILVRDDRVEAIEEPKHSVRPSCRSCEFDNGAIHLPLFKQSCISHPHGFLNNESHDVNENRMTGQGLDRPLTELNPTGIPLFPIRSIRVSFDPDDDSNFMTIHAMGYPIFNGFQGCRIDIAIDPAPRKKDEVSKEVRSEYRERQHIEGLWDLWDRGI